MPAKNSIYISAHVASLMCDHLDGLDITYGPRVISRLCEYFICRELMRTGSTEDVKLKASTRLLVLSQILHPLALMNDDIVTARAHLPMRDSSAGGEEPPW